MGKLCSAANNLVGLVEGRLKPAQIPDPGSLWSSSKPIKPLHMGQKWYPACQLCGGKGLLQHLLSGCPRSLSEGRYCWRHDQVLKVIAEVVSEALKSNRFSPGRHKVIFVRAGSSKQLQTKNKVMLLSSAPDWQLLVDLKRQTKFPAHIVETKLRPDIVMFSNSTKKVIIWELSVPWEENMESTHERKIAKYELLVEQCRAVKRKALKNITTAAEKAMNWLWIRRADSWGCR